MNTNISLSRFAADLASWREKLAADEWHFARLRQDLVGVLPPKGAFVLIDEVVALLLQQREDFARSECMGLLLALAQQADTSEMPPLLSKEWDHVISLSSDPQAVGELRGWYHKPAA